MGLLYCHILKEPFLSLFGFEIIAHVCVFCVCRFYFKKVSDEFDCGVVFEEVRDDDAILPIFEEKIIGKVEKVDWNLGTGRWHRIGKKKKIIGIKEETGWEHWIEIQL